MIAAESTPQTNNNSNINNNVNNNVNQNVHHDINHNIVFYGPSNVGVFCQGQLPQPCHKRWDSMIMIPPSGTPCRVGTERAPGQRRVQAKPPTANHRRSAEHHYSPWTQPHCSSLRCNVSCITRHWNEFTCHTKKTKQKMCPHERTTRFVLSSMQGMNGMNGSCDGFVHDARLLTFSLRGSPHGAPGTRTLYCMPYRTG